ncbi:MAG TPA: DUF58 domain-containing protein, partial [Ferruginibacter sp.]|nr:DUF58 domain-containing protein [Ferruginibacter sp.]
MSAIKKYIGDLFVTTRFYIVVGICIALFIISFFYPPIAQLPKMIWYIIIVLVAIDYLFLFLQNSPLGKRIMSDRFSNGDNNRVELQVTNVTNFDLFFEIIDEQPVQLQERDWEQKAAFAPNQQKNIIYTIRPLERGEYHFGNIIVFVRSKLGLVLRRHTIEAKTMVAVYPLFMQLRKYQLLSNTTMLEHGNKRMRKIGHSMEFEQIKEYVMGDDIRTINWKATARKSAFMVNNYTDEKSQQVFCIIDKGRLMKMPFNGLSLLDHAINSALVLSNICLQKQD